MGKVGEAAPVQAKQFSIADFEAAVGKQMNGDLVIGKGGKLEKVNAWKIKQAKSFHTDVSGQKSVDVRNALLGALTAELKLEDESGKIYIGYLRSRLGLDESNQSLAQKPLARREVKQIIDAAKSFATNRLGWIDGLENLTDDASGQRLVSAETVKALKEIVELGKAEKTQIEGLATQFEEAKTSPTAKKMFVDYNFPNA